MTLVKQWCSNYIGGTGAQITLVELKGKELYLASFQLYVFLKHLEWFGCIIKFKTSVIKLQLQLNHYKIDI